MGSVNIGATHKFVIVLNEKSPIGKLLSATGQIAMSLYSVASPGERTNMSFVPFNGPNGACLVNLSTCSFVVLRGTASQLLTLHNSLAGQDLLSATFTSTMSYSGIEEDLVQKTLISPIDQTEIYGVGLFGSIERTTPLTKKFSVFK